MYDRVEPGFVSGHDDAGMQAAIATVSKAKPADALADLAACIAFLRPAGRCSSSATATAAPWSGRRRAGWTAWRPVPATMAAVSPRRRT